MSMVEKEAKKEQKRNMQRKMILEAEELSVKFGTGNFCLRPVNIHLMEGEILAVIGESGSGKSTMAKALVHMNEERAQVEGRVEIDGKNLYELSEKERKQMRMTCFSIALQNSRELLNPMLTVQNQLEEVLHRKYQKGACRHRLSELIRMTNYPEAALKKYPSELSGGMVQKVLLMSAAALKPKVIILDEPTSALDQDSAKAVHAMIQNIRQEEGTAFLIITHDLYLAKEISDRTMVLYQGMVMESGRTEEIFAAPHHPYTKGLMGSSMDINLLRDIWGIRSPDTGMEKSSVCCPFLPRCNQCIGMCAQKEPVLQSWCEKKDWQISCLRGGIVKILEGRGLNKSFQKQEVLRNVNVFIDSSEVVALVGPSGSGKSTLAHILSGVQKADGGQLLFEGKETDFCKLHRIYGGLQLIHQDPDAALNPDFTVRQAVMEPLVLNEKRETAEQMEENTKELLEAVGLGSEEVLLRQKVRQLSGGQKQKVVIARALALRPRLLIADEITSMLDASSKANLLRQLKQIQNSRGLSMLFITHDQNSARKISDRIYQIDLQGEVRQKRLNMCREPGDGVIQTGETPVFPGTKKIKL